MIWNSRFVRISAGLLLLGAAILALLPTLTGYSSLDGVVNARFAVVAAPIEGTVLQTPPKVGSALAQAEPLTVIHNRRVNRAVAASLAAELETARERVVALRRQRAELEDLREDLSERLGAFQEATVRSLDREIAIIEQRINVSLAQQTAATSEAERRQTLGRTGIVAQSAVEQALAAQTLTAGEVEIFRLNLNRLRLRQEAARRGVLVGDGQNDVPYSRQRMDEVLIQIADIDTRIAENERRAEQTERQLREERTRVERLEATTLVSPFDGVVWRNNVVDGSNVVVGTEVMRILDCRDLFVDILVAEVDHDEIYPGRSAQVRLLGRGETVSGTVLSVRGNSASVEEVTLAATPPEGQRRAAKIRVALERSELNSDYANYCQVGRSVQVRFERRAFPLKRWLEGLWFSIT